MDESHKCPKCKQELSSQNRLITECCGHSKCRECLISEENGCEECRQPTIRYSEDKTDDIQNKSLSSNADKPKASKTEFPAHIVQERINNKTVYRCTVCDKQFNSRTQQYYHLFCNNASNKPFKCDKCIKTFSTSSHLRYHMDGHAGKSFSCSVCSKTFIKLQILRKHEKLHTADAHQCTECGIKLKNKVAFIAHMQRHKNIYQYSCRVCEKKFSLKSTLRMHENIHTGVKNFKCDQCDKRFDRNSTLKLHTLRHSKHKKFNCSECLKTFFDAKSLMRHSRIHIANCKYKCSLCDTISIRKDNITRHIRNMHPNENKNCIEVIFEKMYDLPNQNDAPQLPCFETNSCTVGVTQCNLPKTVPNSSVIKCIGNVQPVLIPQEKQLGTNSEPEAVHHIHSAVTAHKKLKKKYDPLEIYRKILLDDDSIQDNDANGISETPMDDNTKSVQESKVSHNTHNGQQSNFSETHWRKNFKYTYQIQFD